MRREDDVFLCAFESLGIRGFGLTPGDAFEEFCEVFSSHWHWVATEDDRNLGPELKRLKPVLLDLVLAIFTRKGDEFHSNASTGASLDKKGLSKTGFTSPHVLAVH
jgi:hypothetical protein